MPDALAAARFEVALGSRILAHEGVLDALGHLSLRHPTDSGRFLLSRSRSAQSVEPGDVLEFTLDSDPVKKTEHHLFSERVIHGEIYKARPDVMAVVHHHAPAIMPFVIAGVDIVPVFHMGATMGVSAPFWDSRDEFGDTNMLVVKPAEGASLARALGDHAAVLMRRHGATVVGGGVREAVFRSIYMRDNAEYQMRAQLLGGISPLTRGEVKLAGGLFAQPNVVSRTWEYWTARLQAAGATPPGARTASARPASKSATRSRSSGRKKS